MSSLFRDFIINCKLNIVLVFWPRTLDNFGLLTLHQFSLPSSFIIVLEPRAGRPILYLSVFPARCPDFSIEGEFFRHSGLFLLDLADLVLFEQLLVGLVVHDSSSNYLDVFSPFHLLDYLFIDLHEILSRPAFF